MHNYRVADWMSAPAVVVSPTASLAVARQMMDQHRIRRLPVVHHQKLVGIVTLGDLREAQPSEATTLSVYEWRTLLDRVAVSECMTRDPLTIDPNAAVLDAAQIMLANKISGLPVVHMGRVAGMITESDLFRLLISEQLGMSPRPRPPVLVCNHCGASLFRRDPSLIEAGDECWQCHYHLRRCDNCIHFDGIVCMLDRDEAREAVPGRHCPVFSFRLPHHVHVDHQ